MPTRPTTTSRSTRPTIRPPKFKSILDDIVDGILDTIFANNTLEFDFCLGWTDLLGADLPIPIRSSQKLAIAGVVFDFILLIAYLIHGAVLIVYETFLLGTVVGLSKCIGLLGSIPSMLDIACNCYGMVGRLGWIEVFGILLKIGGCLAMLSQWNRLRQNWFVPKFITWTQNGVMCVVMALNLYTLFSSTLFDTRIYQKNPGDNENVLFYQNHWYGLWDICSSSFTENGAICIKWSESRFGTWMASPHWNRPRPIGLDYIIGVIMITLLIELLSIVIRDGWLRRFCLVFVPLSNLALTVGAMYLVNGIPILTIPVLKYQSGTRSFYGAGWFALAGASGKLLYRKYL